MGLSERLAGEFRQKIERGEWVAGVRLPTTRQLATTYRVSVDTIQSAFKALESDDLIERRPRIGGYVKEHPARPPQTVRATTIGVVGPYTEADYAAGMSNTWGDRIIRGCDNGLAASGYHLASFSYSVADPNAAANVLRQIDGLRHTVAGILCFVNEAMEGLIDQLDKRNIPWVAVNRPSEHAAHNFVTHDAFRGARILARCLARMGVEKVLVLSDALGNGRSTGDKFFGFLEGWIESGRRSSNVEFMRAGSFREEHGYEAFLRHASGQGKPDAVFASGDLLALGAMRAARELNIAVPTQMVVVGSTGLDVGAYSHPTLTVLDTPMEKMGQDAAQMLLEMAREGVRRMSGRYARANLLVRESCPILPEMLASEQAAVDRL